MSRGEAVSKVRYWLDLKSTLTKQKMDTSQITAMIHENSETWLSELIADYKSMESYATSIEPP